MLPQFSEIGPGVQITKGFRGPMARVCMRINNDHVAARTHDAAQFTSSRFGDSQRDAAAYDIW